MVKVGDEVSKRVVKEFTVFESTRYNISHDVIVSCNVVWDQVQRSEMVNPEADVA